MYICINKHRHFWVYNKEKIEKYVWGLPCHFLIWIQERKCSYFIPQYHFAVLQPGCSLRDTGNWYLDLLSGNWYLDLSGNWYLNPLSQNPSLHSSCSRRWCTNKDLRHRDSPSTINVCTGESYWGRPAGVDEGQFIDVNRCPRHSSTEAKYAVVRVNGGHYLLSRFSYSLKLQKSSAVERRKAKDLECLRL